MRAAFDIILLREGVALQSDVESASVTTKCCCGQQPGDGRVPAEFRQLSPESARTQGAQDQVARRIRSARVLTPQPPLNVGGHTGRDGLLALKTVPHLPRRAGRRATCRRL